MSELCSPGRELNKMALRWPLWCSVLLPGAEGSLGCSTDVPPLCTFWVNLIHSMCFFSVFVGRGGL